MGTYSTSDSTKQALIAAAGELFAESGFAAVSTRAIARRAGENLGTIHYHFGGKDGLILATVRFASCPWEANPFGAYVSEREHLLADPAGRAELVRGLVGLHYDLLLAEDRPAWCTPVLFHALFRPGPASDYLTEEVYRGNCEALERVYRGVHPESSRTDAMIWASCLVAPFAFHMNYSSLILRLLHRQEYPPEYLTTMRDRVAEQMITALEMPVGKDG